MLQNDKKEIEAIKELIKPYNLIIKKERNGGLWLVNDYCEIQLLKERYDDGIVVMLCTPELTFNSVYIQ